MVESRTKVRLSRRQLEDLVGHAFGGACLRAARELTDGYFNTAWAIELDREPGRVVLKAGPPPGAEVLTYEQGLMRAEVEAMRLTSADERIPVPNVLFADLSRARFPCDYFFMQHADGRPWDRARDELTDEQNARIESELGRITAAINGFTHPTFGYLAGGSGFERWADAFRWMCGLLFADARRFGIDPGSTEDALVDQLRRHHEAFDAVEQPRLVHWDLWAGNVFVVVDDGVPRVSGVIDFERALWGDPLMEFIPGRLGRIEHYVTGYGEDPLATRSQRLRRIFYNVYLALVLIVEDGPRRYTDRSTVEWGRQLMAANLAMLRHGDVIPELTSIWP